MMRTTIFSENTNGCSCASYGLSCCWPMVLSTKLINSSGWILVSSYIQDTACQMLSRYNSPTDTTLSVDFSLDATELQTPPHIFENEAILGAESGSDWPVSEPHTPKRHLAVLAIRTAGNAQALPRSYSNLRWSWCTRLGSMFTYLSSFWVNSAKQSHWKCGFVCGLGGAIHLVGLSPARIV